MLIFVFSPISLLISAFIHAPFHYFFSYFNSSLFLLCFRVNIFSQSSFSSKRWNIVKVVQRTSENWRSRKAIITSEISRREHPLKSVSPRLTFPVNLSPENSLRILTQQRFANTWKTCSNPRSSYNLLQSIGYRRRHTHISFKPKFSKVTKEPIAWQQLCLRDHRMVHITSWRFRHHSLRDS